MKKNKKKGLLSTIIILTVLLLAILILVLIFTKSDVNKITSNQFRTILKEESIYSDLKKGSTKTNGPAVYKNSTVKSLNINASIGTNTVYFSGQIVLNNGKNIKYSSEWNRDFYTQFQNKTITELITPIDNINTDKTNGDLVILNENVFDILSKKITGTKYNEIKNSPVILQNGGVVTIDRNYVPTWQTALITIVPYFILFGLIGGMMYFAYKTQGAGGGLGAMGFGKNKARKVKTSIRFSDVAGIDEEIEELEEIVGYLKDNEKYSKVGARIPKGVLLVGPPGTGKTLLAKAVAGEAGVPFYFVSGSEFEEVFVGLGASRIREMFNQAKKNSPSIIFIDEIDAVGRKRNAIGNGAGDQTLNQLLTEMDSFGTNSGVIVIAATNISETLDPALTRPGRFDRQIRISLPNVKEREAILKIHARNKNLSSEIDLFKIAKRTPGFSGAQLENVLNEAALLVARENKKIISLNIIDEAIDRVVSGPAKKSRKYTFTDKETVSHHEAGHALIGMKLKDASKVEKVTIIPRGSAGGYTIMTPEEETMFQSKAALMATITGFLGGRAAEELMFSKNSITTGAHDDLQKATNIARHMVTEFGMTEVGLIQYESRTNIYQQQKQTYSEEVAKKIDAEINKIMNECYIEAKKIIKENMAELKLIAEALKILETITADQIEYIDKNMKLPIEAQEQKEREIKREKKKSKGEIVELTPEKED